MLLSVTWFMALEVKRVVDSVVNQEIVILEEMVLQSERRGGG